MRGMGVVTQCSACKENICFFHNILDSEHEGKLCNVYDDDIKKSIQLMESDSERRRNCPADKKCPNPLCGIWVRRASVQPMIHLIFIFLWMSKIFKDGG